MYKKLLLTFTVFTLSTNTFAADITHPFFLPETAHLYADTNFTYSHSQIKSHTLAKNNRFYTKNAIEQLKFGILNNFAVIGSISKNWVKNKDLIIGLSEKSHNDLNWNAGLAWNILNKQTKFQLSSVYGQETPGQIPTKGTYKYIDTEVKLGHQFKKYMPYITAKAHIPIAQTSQQRNNRWSYSGTVGLYQGKSDVWALDTALSWNFDRTSTHSRTLAAEAEASYYLTQNITVGVYGSYMLKGKAKNQTDVYDKTLGAHLRFYF